MKPEGLYLCGGVFACASALFAIANRTGAGRDGQYDAGLVICGLLAIVFLAAGLDQWRRNSKGGP
jgi:hypothetical protein